MADTNLPSPSSGPLLIAQRAIDLMQERPTALIAAVVTGQIDMSNT